MAAGDLTTLASAEAWLGVKSDGGAQDGLIAALITAASTYLGSYLARQIGSASYTELYSGNGQDFMLLRQGPVTQVASVQWSGRTLAAADPLTLANGYYMDADGRTLRLLGCRLPHLPVQVSYTAGYQVAGEAQTVPASAPYAVATVSQWLADQGVVYATGRAPLTPVAGTPSAGEYAVSGGVYTFAAADAGKGVLITYATAPQDIVQVCNELVGEAFRRRGRIGQTTQNLGGQETQGFSQADLNAAAKEMLQPYRFMAPL